MSQRQNTPGMMRKPVRRDRLAGLVRMLAEIAVDDYLKGVNARRDEPTTTKDREHARGAVRSL